MRDARNASPWQPLDTALESPRTASKKPTGTWSRSIDVRKTAVVLWILSLFVNASVSVGPVTNLRAADVASLMLVLVALPIRSVSSGSSRLPVALWALVGMAVTALLALPLVQDPTLAVVGVVQLVEYVLVALALLRILTLASSAERERFIGLFVAAACAEAALAILQSLTHHGLTGQPTRGTGTLGLFLAFYLGVALVYALWKTLGSLGRARALWATVALLLAGGLAASETRTTWAAAGIAALVLLALREGRRALALGAATVAAASLLSLALSFSTHSLPRSGVLTRAASIGALLRGNTSALGNWTLGVRSDSWQIAAETGWHHPLGYGLKNLRLILPGLLYEREPERLKFATVDILGPHNQYLSTFAELGWPGVILLGALLVDIARRALRLNAGIRPLAVALVLVVALESLLSDVLFGLPGLVIAGLVAILLAQGDAPPPERAHARR